MKRFLQISLWLLVGVAGVTEAKGQLTIFWRDNAANGNWENGTCADIGTPPSQWWYPTFTPNNARNRPDCFDGSTTRHNLIIDNNHQTTMTLNTAFWGIRSLTFANTATTGRTINSSPDDGTRGISLTNGIFNNANSGVTHTFNGRIGIDAGTVTLSTATAGATTTYNRDIFGNANNIIFDGSGTTNVTAVISGVGASVTKNGSGTLTFSGSSANTYTGLTSVNAGTLVLSKTAGTAALPAALTIAAGATVRTDAANQWGTGTPPLVTLNGNAILNLNNFNQRIALASASTTSSVTLGSATLEINNTGNDTYAGVISGTGGLIKSNSGTQTLSGNNTFTGGTALNQGILNINSATAIGTGALTIGGASTINNSSGGAITLTNNNTLNLTGASGTNLTFTGSNNLYFGSGGIQISNAGKELTISGGTLTFGGGINADNSGNRTFTKSGGGTLILNGAAGTYSGTTSVISGILGIGNNTALGTGSINFGGTSASDPTIRAEGGARVINNNLFLTTINTGNQIITGSNSITFNGVTTADASRTLTNTISGGQTLTFGGNVFISDNNTTGSRVLTFNGTGETIINGIIANNNSGNTVAAGLTYSGTGILTLTNANTYSGITTLNSGTLNINNATAIGTGAFTITGGTINNTSGSPITLTNNNVQNWNGDFTFTGTNNLNLGSGAVTLSANRQVIVSANTLTVGGAISGGFGLTKLGTGTLELSGESTYTGTTIINVGTLLISGGNNRLPTGTALSLATGTTLDLNNQNQQIGSLASITTGGNVTLGSGTLTIGGTATTTFSGAISGSGGLTKQGAGLQTLSGTNTYGGATTINAGDIIYNSAGALPNASNVVLAGGRMVMANTIPTAAFAPGTLTLGGTINSEIVLGTSANAVTITFANSSAIWPAGRRITIRNWSPTGNKNIFFTGGTSGLNPAQLDVIDFDGYGLGAKFDGLTGRIIPRFIYVTQSSGGGNFSAPASWLNGDNPTGTSCASNPATIVIQSGFTLTQDVNYDLTRIENSGIYLSNAFTITLCGGGSFVNNGTVDFTTAGGGTLVCSGTATFSGSAPSSSFGLNNLTLNGAATLTPAPTIRGILIMNSGSSIVTQAPVYANTSTLVYNQGSTLTMGLEWSTGNASSIGAGLPQNVTIQNSTILDQPGSNRGCAGNLLISSGNLRLSTTTGFDLYVAGNFTNNSTFTHRDRAVFLVGSNSQTLNGILNGTTTTNCLPFLLIDKSGGTVTLNTPVSVTNTLTLTNGTITLGTNNLTITSGNAIAGGAFDNSRMIITNSTGQLVFGIPNDGANSDLFPIGVGTNYTPITINVTGSTGTNRTIGMRVVDAAVPNTPLNTPTSPTHYITRYWVPSSSGFTSISWNGIATYAASGDEVGTATNIRFSVWHPAPENSWMDYGIAPIGQTLTGGTNITDLNALSSSAFITGRDPAPKLFYRSVGSGSWSSPTIWETATDAGFTALITPTLVGPSAMNSSGITIRNGHTVTIDGIATLDQCVIETSSVLFKANGGVLTINDGTAVGDDLDVYGTFSHDGGSVATFNGTVRVRGNATLEVLSNTGGGSSAYGNSNRIWYENASTFYWKETAFTAFSTGAASTYFVNSPDGIIPNFRIGTSLTNITLSVGGNTLINGTFEVDAPRTVTWNNPGNVTFRNGILGSGNVTQGANNTGIFISGTTSVLGGSGTVTLNTAGLQITGGTCTLQSSKPMAGTGTFTVNNGATLNASTFALSGSAPFTLAAGGTLVSASSTGVNGSITTTGTKTFTAGANYTFNGTTNQTTGNLMGTIIGSLTINNTGTSPNNIVTLTNNNHEANILNLQAGIFRCGFGQTLIIPNNGVVNGTGGNQDNNTASGIIHFHGTGTINATLTGQPQLYNVIVGNGVANGGVNMAGSGSSNPSILHRLELRSQGYLTNAPFYATNSTLVYNSGGVYEKRVEMGQTTVGQPGYPWHVTIQGGSTLNLLPSNVPNNQGMSGNLTVGLDGSGNGGIACNDIVHDLVVGDNLIIGGTSATGNILLSSVIGADLFINGSYTRTTSSSTFSPNGRAVFFTGSTAATINAPLPGPEILPFVIVDKGSSFNNTLTLNSPVDITNKLTLTSGRVITTSNLLRITNSAPDDATNGIEYTDGNPAYIDGPLRREVNTTSGSNSYVFPVGRLDGSTHFAKRIRMKELTNGAGSFTVTYERGNPPGNPGLPTYFFQSTIKGIRESEYWNVDRTGSIQGRIVLPYTYIAGNTWKWFDGTNVTPNLIARVAVVRGSGTNSANWNFTQPLVSNFTTEDENPVEHEARIVTSYGDIISRHIDDFSPFTFGWGFNQVLILPLKLLGFTAKATGPDVLLQWQYADAKDLAYTTIEYSTDGQRFRPLQRVAGTTALHYNHTHLQPGTGVHYYRLLMADKNGETSYSAVQVVQIGVNQSYITGLLQNPVQGTQALVQGYSATAQTARVLLTDVQGRRLLAANYQLAQGSFSLPVSLLPVAKGNYYLQLMLNDGTSKTMKVVY